jgi:hypothetical protein
VSEPPLPLLPRTAPVIEQRPGTGNRTTVASSTVLPTSQASEVRGCARSYQAHPSDQDIPELRELVDVRRPQDSADLSHPRGGGRLEEGTAPPCVGLVHCRHLPRRPCGQSRVISAGRGFWNRGGR